VVLKKDSAIVLFSGGQDSTVCLLWACNNFKKVETVGFNYNQRHVVEMDCRLDILLKIKSNHKNIAQVIGDDHIIDIASLGKLSETSLTRDSKILIEKSGLPNTFVPGRNLLFLTMASALGWRRNIFNLVGGMCQTDYSGYPDCRKDTINAQEKTLSLGLDKKVKIYTPLMYLNKKEIWQLAKEIGGDDFIELIINNTHSCYLGDRSKLNRWGFGCGSCPSCILRSKGYDDWIEK